MKKSLYVLSMTAALWACGSDDEKAAPVDASVANDAMADAAGLGEIPDETPDTLSAWNLFEDLATLTPRERVVPYEMNSPLFTDYAAKHRFIYLPEGKKIGYRDHGGWAFPVGTILIKDFAYPKDEGDPKQGERHIETRLLIHREESWVPEVYVWNDEQTDAVRDVTGETVKVTRHRADGTKQTFDYGVPTRAECRKCHGTTPPIDGAQATRALGPMTGQLHRDNDYGDGPVNQIDHLASLGWFDVKPPPAKERLRFPAPDQEKATLSDRARGYLQANCAHCHSEGGEVFDKELWLDWESTDPEKDPYRWGVCKKPTSAGNAECDETIDIVPGKPDQSLLLCRMKAKGKGRMAPLGRNLVHAEGVALIRDWIASLEYPSCTVE